MTDPNRHDFDPRTERCRHCGCPRQLTKELDHVILCKR
jgi:hypothetical protein